MLGELLRYANRKEIEEIEKETEKRLFPLWLANYVASKIKGEETLEYGDFLMKTMQKTSENEEKPAQSEKKSAEEIVSDFERFLPADWKGHI